MIKKISLGVFYGFLGASFLEFLKSVFSNQIDLSLPIKRIVIIAISGFFIGAFIAGMVEKEQGSIPLGSKKSGYLILLGTLIAFVISVFL